jgi:hypothetical protein
MRIPAGLCELSCLKPRCRRGWARSAEAARFLRGVDDSDLRLLTLRPAIGVLTAPLLHRESEERIVF